MAIAPKDNFGKARVYVLGITDGGSATVSFSTYTSDWSNISATALSPERALIVYKDTAGTRLAIIANVDDSNYVTFSDSMVYHTAELKKHEVLALSSASAIILHTNTGGTGLIYTGLNIDDDILTQEGIGTYIQPATSRLRNVGIAKTSGTEG